MANVGSVDRILRAAAGILLIVLCLVPPGDPVLLGLGLWRWAVAALGAILLFTAAARFCPAYRLIGVNTCSRH